MKSKNIEVSTNRKQISLIIPGMLNSTHHFIESIIPQWHRHNSDMNASVPGAITTTCMISGHCCEILLKYVLSKENIHFSRTHNLYSLYNLLSPNAKELIDKEFEILSSNISLEEGWDNVDSILNNCKDLSMNMRYDMFELDDGVGRKSFYYNHIALYLTARSIFNATDISKESHVREQVSGSDQQKYLNKVNK